MTMSVVKLVKLEEQEARTIVMVSRPLGVSQGNKPVVGVLVFLRGSYGVYFEGDINYNIYIYIYIYIYNLYETNI